MKLPNVWTEGFSNLVELELQKQAAMQFKVHQLPESLSDWEARRHELRENIWKNLGTGKPDHSLPLDMRETGSTKMDGYTVKNICYQSRPGFYVTGNLYVPDNAENLPGVIVMHGHWEQGRLAERVQARGHSLARNNYVCLTVDAFGSGERSTRHGEFEYHGANLGGSLLNVGESLMGTQIVDNMRGVDLLCSLPYVDANRIGATGASGGGNQTMWLAAMDERVKAAIPVVSVGTFESYVTRRNCVCELLPNGLTFTEESGVLALIAPRALKMLNAIKDSNPTFQPAEMLRSYTEARKVYQAYEADSQLAYQTFNLPHGYWPEMREAMLGWFNLHLKGRGTGAPEAEIPFESLPEKDLMVFEKGTRIPEVRSIQEFCVQRGKELRHAMLNCDTFDVQQKKLELKEILKVVNCLELKEVHEYSTTVEAGRTRRTLAVETRCGKLIPALVFDPLQGRDYYIISKPYQKHDPVLQPVLSELFERGCGIIIPDLSLTGENNGKPDPLCTFHDEARAFMWLGKTILGEWTRELELFSRVAVSHLRGTRTNVVGFAEGGLAALLSSVIFDGMNALEFYDMPLSYEYGTRPPEFSMAIHVPGILRWGDISLAAALNNASMTIKSGKMLDGSIGDICAFTKEMELIKTKFVSFEG